MKFLEDHIPVLVKTVRLAELPKTAAQAHENKRCFVAPRFQLFVTCDHTEYPTDWIDNTVCP